MEYIEYRVDTIALRKLMVENNINTFTEMAEKSGVVRDTVASVVKGDSRPSTAVIEKFMAALNIDPVNAGPIFFVPVLRDA